MSSLKTKFIGLDLKSPVIAGSCGITTTMESLRKIAEQGAGAVILKSVFEEQIHQETSYHMEDSYPEEEEYLRHYIRAHAIQKHIDLIKVAKSELDLPIIASINCIRDGEWVHFAKELEKAGADALELNIFMLPTDEFVEGTVVENSYFKVLKHVKSEIKIPIIVKISSAFTNLATFVSKLKAYGANAVTLFNRFYEPDIDIEQMKIQAASVLSTPADVRTSLRWTGILAGKDRQLEISASTGVHGGDAVVKLLLAGATTVQVCSAMYLQGIECIGKMNQFVEEWMMRHEFETIDEFRRQLSYAHPEQDEYYERAQFMKYFGDKKI